MTASKMTVNGVSVCATGQENYDPFENRTGQRLYQYDYRHTDGVLFSTVMQTLEQCRERRDKWLKQHLLRNSAQREFRQDGMTVAVSGDWLTMAIMFGNLTGTDYTEPVPYSDYVRKMTSKLPFKYGEIELVADGVTLATGTIRETL